MGVNVFDRIKAWRADGGAFITHSRADGDGEADTPCRPQPRRATPTTVKTPRRPPRYMLRTRCAAR
eukprot:877212-Prymnesium_polylepis.1